MESLNFVYIYGLITILALSFYYYVLRPKNDGMVQSQRQRDMSHLQMTTEISNAALSINELVGDPRNDRLKMFHDLEISKFLIGHNKYDGHQIYYFLDKWLVVYSLNQKPKIN